jgi:TPR repeat protein
LEDFLLILISFFATLSLGWRLEGEQPIGEAIGGVVSQVWGLRPVCKNKTVTSSRPPSQFSRHSPAFACPKPNVFHFSPTLAFTHWLLVKAEEGDADAQAAVGLAHYRGEGLPKDYNQAVSWLKKAARSCVPT